MNRKTKKLIKHIIIILVVAIVINATVMGFSAFTRYTLRKVNSSTVKVARWNFNLVDANIQTTDIIEFSITRTDTNITVAEGTIAPGTYGKFEVGMDASGTDTTIQYIIEVECYDKPVNLKFYLDENRTEEMVTDDNMLTKIGYITVEDNKDIRVETIYWEWPFETGITDEEKQVNNEQDTKDANKEIMMKILVTGIGVVENNALD